MTHVACDSKLRSDHPSFHAKETGWQSEVRSCNMLGLLVHLLPEINAGTVVLGTIRSAIVVVNTNTVSGALWK